MRKGWLSLLMILILGLVFTTVGILSAADVPDEVNIENKCYAKDKKGPVPLSHNKHVNEYGAKCSDCHHDYQDGKNVWKEGDPVKKCVDCHDPNKSEGNVKKLQTAYHGNCKDCHKEAIAAGKKNAPYKKCTDCHQK